MLEKTSSDYLTHFATIFSQKGDFETTRGLEFGLIDAFVAIVALFQQQEEQQQPQVTSRFEPGFLELDAHQLAAPAGRRQSAAGGAE